MKTLLIILATGIACAVGKHSFIDYRELKSDVELANSELPRWMGTTVRLDSVEPTIYRTVVFNSTVIDQIASKISSMDPVMAKANFKASLLNSIKGTQDEELFRMGYWGKFVIKDKKGQIVLITVISPWDIYG